MTNHIFHEPEPGLIEHTAASRELAQDAALQDWVGFNAEDVFPSAARVLESLKAYPEATSLTTTGFNFAFDTVEKEPMFVTFGKDAARAKRMGGAMASLTEGEGYEVDHFTDNYDMSEIDENRGIFVDIGGSHGFVCVDLAKKWKKMTFVVQDLPKTVDSAPNPICDDESVAARIQLQVHDFFTEQPVKGADGMQLLVGRALKSSRLPSRLTGTDWRSLFLPLDHTQLLDALRRQITQKSRPCAETGIPRCHQRPLPARPWDGEAMGREADPRHGHGHADAAERARARRARLPGTVPGGG